MVKQQSGFTLIELIAVLVILGILAATAIPKFVNLSDEAQTAALQNIAGSIESASALNHAVDLANEAGLSDDPVVSVTSCADATNLLEGGLPTNYSITNGSLAVSDQATQGGCNLQYDPNPSSNVDFALIGAVPPSP